MLTLSQAAKISGKSKSVIGRALKEQRLKGEQLEDGTWQITEEDLHQVYPPARAKARTEERAEHSRASEDGQVLVTALQSQVEDLKDQLEKSDNRFNRATSQLEILEKTRAQEAEAAVKMQVGLNSRIIQLEDETKRLQLPPPTPEKRSLLARIFT